MSMKIILSVGKAGIMEEGRFLNIWSVSWNLEWILNLTDADDVRFDLWVTSILFPSNLVGVVQFKIHSCFTTAARKRNPHTLIPKPALVDTVYTPMARVQIEWARREKIDKDITWTFLRMFLMSCDWNLSKTQFGILLEYFQWEAIGIWKRQSLDLSENIFDERPLEFGKDRIETCLRKFSMRGDWNLAKTSFRLVLEKLRREATGIWQRQDLDLS